MAAEDALITYGEKVVSELREAIKSKSFPRNNGSSYVMNASGNLERKLRFTVENNVLRVYAEKYIGALIFGRRPNKNQTPESLKAWVGWAGSTFIKQWADVKGIRINPYAIAWKIARKGNSFFPQGSDLLSAVVTQESIDELKSNIVMEMTAEVFAGLKTLKKAA